MIVTDLAHVSEQIAKSAEFEKAIAFLRRTDLATLADGIFELEGKRVYASVQSYTTFPIGTLFKFEAHRQHIDFQYMVEGEETIGWIPAQQIAFDTPYDAAGDIQFGSAPTRDLVLVKLRRQQLTVLFPSDGHAPRHTVSEPTPVKKIVVKVAVE